jgi:cold shock CspA family protein
MSDDEIFEGRVSSWKGAYGFIRPKGRNEFVFVYKTHLLNCHSLEPGDIVRYKLTTDLNRPDGKLLATDVVLLPP